MSRVFLIAFDGAILDTFMKKPFWSCSPYLLIVSKLVNDLRVPEVATPHFVVLGTRKLRL